MIIAVYGSARPAAGEALYEDARRLGALWRSKATQ